MVGGGDSSTMAFVPENDREADERLLKKQKQEQPQPAEETRGVNPLDPIYSEYDPKQRKFAYTRYFFNPQIDLDLESPACPMRHTDKKFREGLPLPNSANVLSVKIVSSDYDYPLNVYGTVIARDNLDRHCVYLFRRGKDNCQSITSKDNSLILTGPKRGLLLCDSIFFEIDLKVKDAHGREVDDERLSKGLLELDGIIRQTSNVKHGIETYTLVSMHSILDLRYAFVRNAVEGTVEIRIIEGPADFHGKITASTTSVPCDIVLHDSEVNGLLTAGDNGVMQTARRIVGVSVDEMLLVNVAPAGCDEFPGRTVNFTPKLNSSDEEYIVCGNYKMQVKVTWSILM
uniref:Uncharacterized protein n=2 Tax=Avena sativa TaxID=4498 RepID=A0ACD5UHU4_AVESA